MAAWCIGAGLVGATALLLALTALVGDMALCLALPLWLLGAGGGFLVARAWAGGWLHG